MSNIVLSWVDPVVRADGSALSAADISAINVSLRVVGAPGFTPSGSVAAGVQTATITDLPAGDYEFLIQVADTQKPTRFSQGVIVSASIAVPALAQPGDVTNAAAVVV